MKLDRSLAEDAARFIPAEASVSDKIRALNAAGYARAEIARILGKRYQHVRNVLEADRLKHEPVDPVRPSAPAPAESVRVGKLFRMPIGHGGLVRLPGEVMKALDLREGGVVVARLEGEVLTVMSPRESLSRARALVPQWRPGDPLWSEELIADRRREAANEEADG